MKSCPVWYETEEKPSSLDPICLLSPFLLQDPFLAEMLQSNKSQIVCYHEHDSLLDHKEEEALSEEDRKAAWAEYEAEKKVGNEKKAHTGQSNTYSTHLILTPKYKVSLARPSFCLSRFCS